jgi:hypothetical protein
MDEMLNFAIVNMAALQIVCCIPHLIFIISEVKTSCLDYN